MDDTLKKYLSAHGAVDFDPALLREHTLRMIDVVIPNLLGDLQTREQLAAEQRYSPSATSYSKKKRD